MKSLAAKLALVALLFIVAGCGSSDSPENIPETTPEFITQSWTVSRGNAQLQGSVPDPVIVNPEIAWTFDAGSAISGDAAVYDGLAYFGSDMGLFFAVKLDSGEEVWQYDLGDVVESEPAIADGLVFVGSNNGWFVALDANTGEERWSNQYHDKVTAGANFTKDPETGDTWVLVAGNDGILRSLRAADGSEVWSYETDNLINGSPAMLDEQHVIFGGCDSYLHIIDVRTGESVSEFETEAYIPSSVAVYQGIGYCGNYANQVIAFDPEYTDGEAWVYSDKSFPFFSSPAVTETRVFIGSRDKRLHAIDRETGSVVWTYRTAGRVDSSPLAFSDAVVFGSTDGWLYALDQVGEEAWKMELGSSLISSPIYANGIILIGTQAGSLFALRSGPKPTNSN